MEGARANSIIFVVAGISQVGVLSSTDPSFQEPPQIIAHQKHPSTKERVIRQSNQNIHSLKPKYLKREGLNKRRRGAGGETGKENEISEQHKNPKLKPKQKTKKHTATS